MKIDLIILYYGYITMEFCPVCGNLFYLKTVDRVLFHTCKKCGNEKEITGTTTIFQQNFTKTNQEYESTINKYTKLDPTLPRIYNMKCPNTECKTNTNDTTPEIIYLRYDDDNLKYLYICSDCDTTWKTNEKE
jgi:DNA-directed RNA polymerase subunit M/transcription elongation factor TFIIS